MSSDPKEDLEEVELSEEHEYALDMVRDQVFEAVDSGIPEEVLILFLLQMATELSVVIGVKKNDFMVRADELFDEIEEESLIEQASLFQPLEA